MKEADGVEFVQLTGGRPAQLLPHVRYLVKLTSARTSAQRKVQVFFEALYVFFRPISKDSQAVPDVREDQGIDNVGSRWYGI